MKSALCVPAFCLAAWMAAGLAANADTFTFTATGPLGWSGSGTITAVAASSIPNAFDVTAISGVVEGQAIAGLLPCANYSLSNPCISSGNSFLYDNLLYPGGTGLFGIQFLDDAGIGFALASGVDADFLAYATHFSYFTTNTFPSDDQIIAFQLTPEPDSFLLLGTGILALAGMVRRRLGAQA